ncbi:MAG: DNA polymerase III subunit gamma/tau [Planctomycetota bacterium]
MLGSLERFDTYMETRPQVSNESLEAGADGAYQVIARRYRPRFFSEVAGQEAIAESLRQAILQHRLAHAYLFCGPRGVGKTSMARIFARALRCPESVDANPCDRCTTCARILSGEDLDVLELDGASHRGIDDVRELIQHVRYAPTSGRYRIFIIDEVHMLTREAFNALLKTLEEPPAHVKFIFATTEPEKLPATVLSRCQRCDFAAMAPDAIVKRLAQICELEGAAPEPEVLVRIARLAKGGMRDAQSLLDQLLSFSGPKATIADLDRLTGRVSPEVVNQILDLAFGSHSAELLERCAHHERSGTDPSVLVEQLIDGVRERVHAGVKSGWRDEQIETHVLGLELLQEARHRMRQLGRAEVTLELALLRLSTLPRLVPLASLLESAGPPNPQVTATTSKPIRAGDAHSARPATVVAPNRERSAVGAPEIVNTAGAVGAGFDRDRVAECLRAVSMPFAKMVEPSVRLDPVQRVVRIELSASARNLLTDDRAQMLRSQFDRAFGAGVRLELIAANDPGRAGGGAAVAQLEESAAPAASESKTTKEPIAPAPSASLGNSSAPPIVDKAVEIFRGKLRGGGK